MITPEQYKPDHHFYKALTELVNAREKYEKAFEAYYDLTYPDAEPYNLKFSPYLSVLTALKKSTDFYVTEAKNLAVLTEANGEN